MIKTNKIMCILFVLLLISGCQEKDGGNAKKHEGGGQKESLLKVSDKLQNLVNDSSLQYTGILREMNVKAAKDVFIKDKKVTSYKKEKDLEFKTKDMYSYEIGNKESLVIRPGEVFYYHELGNKYSELLSTTQQYCDEEVEKNFKLKKVENQSPDAAFQNVKDISKKLGINVTPEKIIALDKKNLEQRYNTINNDLSDDESKWEHFWSNNDEGYLIICRVNQDGNCFYSRDYNDKDNNIVSANNVSAIIRNGQIIQYHAAGIYDLKKVAVNNKLVNKSNVDQQLLQRYQDVVIKSPVEIKDISLLYVPVLQKDKEAECKFIPAYVYSMTYTEVVNDELKGKVEIDQRKDEIISAVDGTWLS